MKNSARQQALRDNKLKYASGKPCKAGHNALRYTKTGQCSLCQIEYNRRYTQSHVPLISDGKHCIFRRLINIQDAGLIAETVDAIISARKLNDKNS